MLTWRKRGLRYLVLAVSVLVQALSLIGVAWIFSSTLPSSSFSNSVVALLTLIVTTIPIAWFTQTLFLESGDTIDGAILLGMGILAGSLAQNGLMDRIVLVFGFWGVVIGVIVLCEQFGRYVFRRFGW